MMKNKCGKYLTTFKPDKHENPKILITIFVNTHPKNTHISKNKGDSYMDLYLR